MTRHEKVTYGSALLISGISFFLIWKTMRPVDTKPVEVRTAAEQPLNLPKLPDTRNDPSVYSVIDERPIFVVDRRMPPSNNANADVSKPVAATPPFYLVGVMILNGKKLAAVRSDNDQEATSLSIGQSVSGWTVENIQRDTVILKSNKGQQILHLADDENN